MLETLRLQKEDYNVSRECQRLQDEFLTEIKAALQTKFIRANKDVKIRIINSKEVKIVTALLIAKQEMVRRAAERLVEYFVFVVLIMTEWWCHSSKSDEVQWTRFSFAAYAVSDCRNVVPTIRQGVFTEYTSGAYITNTTVFSSAQITYVLVTQELNDSRCMKMNCHPDQSCHVILFTGLYVTTWTARSSPKRHCIQRISSKKLHCRKASLKNHSRTSITRVTETYEENTPL